MLELRNISLAYDQQPVLENISYIFQQGIIYGIIGPNGAGKSSLLRVMTAMERPSAGQVLWAGQPLLRHSTEITCMWQKPHLFSGSVRDNLLYGLKIRGWSKTAQEERLATLLANFKLQEYEGKRVEKLSGGEGARVALARTVAPRPKLLVLDEPAANLDPSHTAQLEDALHLIVREEKISIVMVTHDLFQAKRVAGETLFLNRGQLVESGATERIFADPASVSTAKFIRGELLEYGN